MNDKILSKLNILAGAAKYDVSCASSGSNRSSKAGSIGNTVGCGICHSFTEDGRCISLLKILLSNQCIYDCAYCVNRSSNDIQRTAFTVDELAELTINFYRRNYIEGLFLSSGVMRSPDYTMEKLMLVAKKLREEYHFNAYIHLKAIPGASPELIRKAGLYADRLSVNIEIPTEQSLKLLAPDKDFSSVYQPMQLIKDNIISSKEERKKYRKAPLFSPAGQSTQLVIGASPENDKQILQLASGLYTNEKLKRVYYSGFVPVPMADNRLPVLLRPPLVRENRLYQADWLLRFYEFKVDEIVNDEHQDLDLELDPKLSYALRNPYLYPIDINKADYEMILRVPGIGLHSAKLIVTSRRYGKLNEGHLKKMGVVLKRAKYFITCNQLTDGHKDLLPAIIRRNILSEKNKPGFRYDANQLSLFED
ncbi:MAG: putative DNA modification/repair radical SAM protein [Bacteroidetes bacterium]|nr:putative DNA modification/repair radical SAM protein [Bacteroidota bacterium]